MILRVDLLEGMMIIFLKSQERKGLPMSSDLPLIVAQMVKEAVSHPELYQTKNLYALVLESVESILIEKTMEYTGGNRSKAAQILGINRNTLSHKMKKYGLNGKGR